jgi:branched-chain amino acid transport system ATP-binding protein
VSRVTQISLEVNHRGYVFEIGNIALEDEAKNLLQNDEVKRAYWGG